MIDRAQHSESTVILAEDEATIYLQASQTYVLATQGCHILLKPTQTSRFYCCGIVPLITMVMLSKPFAVQSPH